MARFIELHDAGDEESVVLVNVETIAFISQGEDGSCIHFCCPRVSSNGYMEYRVVKENLYQIKAKIDE